MSLNKVIKNNLKETKKRKETLLIEQKIIHSRLNVIIESIDTSEKFNKLSTKQQEKISILFLMELSSLNEEGLLNENFIDVLKNIFGSAFYAVPEAFVEKALNSILGSLGFPDNSIKKFLVSFFATNPSELLKSFKDCNVMTKNIVRAIGEVFIMNLQQSKNLGGVGMDMVRNALQNQLQSTAFVSGLEKSMSSFVCELFNKYSGNATEMINKIKPALSTAIK